MKIFTLTDHSDGLGQTRVCHHEKSFLFQMNFDFYLVIYCYCLQGHSHLDFKEMILGQVAKKYGMEEIERSISTTRFKKETDIDKLLERRTTEICYIYYDNAGKEFGMTTKMSYLKFIEKSTGYPARFREAIKDVENLPLDKDEIDRLKGELHRFIRLNNTDISYLSEYQKIKLTDLITNKILKLCN